MAKKNKKETLEEAVAQAVGAGQELRLETVDFSKSNRPKTCLEVDFPIIPINRVSSIEASSGAAKKPIYQMSKWWARRQSSVFRAMLIAAATKAPDESAEAAELVWKSYYGNHQANHAFSKLTVADIFMGGGTTLVEGARLGMQMYGSDQNPVAWLIVKNSLAQANPKEVKQLLDHIESEVKPQIMPFYACDCPRGHKGKWKQNKTGKIMGIDFDPLALTPDERIEYVYEGPEIIYTFWSKHGICQGTECDHRTPIMSSPIVAVKTVVVRAWPDRECTKCSKYFDVERHEARLAPDALFVVSSDEKPYAVMDNAGIYSCPHCGHKYHDEPAAWHGKSVALNKAKTKSVELTLLVHPEWIKGSDSSDKDGKPFGGRTHDSVEATAKWYRIRASTMKLIEVRGALTESIICPDTGEVFFTDYRGGTVPRKATLSCKEPTCGRQEDVLTLIDESGDMAPYSPYAECIVCPECQQTTPLMKGRSFRAVTDPEHIIAAFQEWERLKATDLTDYWPRTDVPPGLETSVRTPLQKYHYHNWSDFFNPRQLLVHSLLLNRDGKYQCEKSQLRPRHRSWPLR